MKPFKLQFDVSELKNALFLLKGSYKFRATDRFQCRFFGRDEVYLETQDGSVTIRKKVALAKSIDFSARGLAITFPFPLVYNLLDTLFSEKPYIWIHVNPADCQVSCTDDPDRTWEEGYVIFGVSMSYPSHIARHSLCLLKFPLPQLIKAVSEVESAATKKTNPGIDGLGIHWGKSKAIVLGTNGNLAMYSHMDKIRMLRASKGSVLFPRELFKQLKRLNSQFSARYKNAEFTFSLTGSHAEIQLSPEPLTLTAPVLSNALPDAKIRCYMDNLGEYKGKFEIDPVVVLAAVNHMTKGMKISVKKHLYIEFADYDEEESQVRLSLKPEFEIPDEHKTENGATPSVWIPIPKQTITETLHLTFPVDYLARMMKVFAKKRTLTVLSVYYNLYKYQDENRMPCVFRQGDISAVCFQVMKLFPDAMPLDPNR